MAPSAPHFAKSHEPGSENNNESQEPKFVKCFGIPALDPDADGRPLGKYVADRSSLCADSVTKEDASSLDYGSQLTTSKVHKVVPTKRTDEVEEGTEDRAEE